MIGNMYTLDDLYDFCKNQNFSHFDSSIAGAPVVVSTYADADVMESNGLIQLQLKACHTGKNAKRTSISDDTMNMYKDTFKTKPILAYIHMCDTGNYEFYTHNFEKNADGSITFLEQPIGVVSEVETPELKYDVALQKNFLYTTGYVFDRYTKAGEILRRRKSCKCSVEIGIDEFNWDSENDCLNITKFSFVGVTLLGYMPDGVTEVGEGMKGSVASLADFSMTDSVYSTSNTELIQKIEQLTNMLSTFSINNTQQQKGECTTMNHFKELLAKYGVTAEDVKFDTEGVSDEQLDALFAENFDEPAGEPEGSAEGGEPEGSAEGGEPEGSAEGGEPEGGEPEVETEVEPEGGEPEGEPEGGSEGGEPESTYSIVPDENGNLHVNFTLSHEDIRSKLYTLLDSSRDNCYYYICNVYDKYFIVHAEDNSGANKYIKIGYSIEDDNLSLTGNSEEVFAEFLTQSEKDVLNQMRQNYDALKSFKDKYDAAEVRAKKTALFTKQYAAISNTTEYTTLLQNIDKYSEADIALQLKALYGEYSLKRDAADYSEGDTTRTNKIGVAQSSKPKKKLPYGNLFDK